jgi:hypothetical protein
MRVRTLEAAAHAIMVATAGPSAPERRRA